MKSIKLRVFAIYCTLALLLLRYVEVIHISWWKCFMALFLWFAIWITLKLIGWSLLGFALVCFMLSGKTTKEALRQISDDLK